jgi:uracil-DNA glycosylase
MISRWRDLPFFKSDKAYEILLRMGPDFDNEDNYDEDGEYTGPGEEYCYVPCYGDVFKALDNPKGPERTRVVILGQDPYPTPGHANGYAFSVGPKVNPLPRSLKNIFAELVSDLGCRYPSNGDLTPWAKQGVLLLNTCLTTKPFQPGAHRKLGWQELTKQVLTELSENTEGRVFILWGRDAQQYEHLIDQKKHLVIKSVHPSPLSAHHGFFGSRPFTKTNAYLKAPINWELP